MQEAGSLRRLTVGFSFLSLTAMIAILGYVIAGWSFIDAVYMVIITVFGVGYGEVQPIESPVLKIFTATVVIAGCSSGIYVVGGFVQMIAEGEIHRALGARRMSRGVKQVNDHIIICGFGRVGQLLASELKQLDQVFVCVDTDKERIMAAEEKGYLVVLGNAGDEETLRQAGIERAKVVAAVLPDDAANVFITLTVRELREDVQIISRGESFATQRKLLRSGANHVVLPAAIGASKIAHMIASPSAETLVADPQQREKLNGYLTSLGLAIREVRVEAESAVANGKLSDLELARSGTVIVAIRSPDGTLRRNPEMNEVVHPGDVLFLLSHQEKISAVLKQVTAKKIEMVYRGAKATH